MQRGTFATKAYALMCWISLALFPSSHGQFCTSKDDCRRLEFMPAHTLDCKRLKGHVIRTDDVMDCGFCETLCYLEPNCVSYNLKKTPRVNGKFGCELSNSTFEGKKNKLKPNPDYIYRGAKNACLKTSCKNNATCQTGFTDKGYRCLCTTGFMGSLCETDINECKTGTHKCSAHAVCKNTKGSYNCTCKPGYYGNGRDCEPVSTCKAIYNKNTASQGNKAYLLQMPSGMVPVYCHMSSHGLGACGGGGWTLVMKIDGNKPTFHFTSKFWSNKVDFNLPGGKTLFDNHETKLPTYWNTPFSKICLGMKIGHQTRFIVITKHATSLHSLIDDGNYRATSLGRNTWKSLLGSFASLQPNCNKEGFNVVSLSDKDFRPKARIGIIANEQNDCNTPDSRIGFGTGGYPYNSSTCGSQAKHGGDNGDKDTKAMGYILVQ